MASPITGSQLLEYLLEGELLIVGEYRGSRVTPSRFVDRNTGNVMGRDTILHFVECGHGPSIVRVTLTEMTLAGIRSTDVTARCLRGHRYVFFIRSIKREQGLITGQLASREPEELECSYLVEMEKQLHTRQ